MARGLSFRLPMHPGAWLSRRRFGARHRGEAEFVVAASWALAPEEVVRRLASTVQGLTSAQADQRLRRIGPNRLQ